MEREPGVPADEIGEVTGRFRDFAQATGFVLRWAKAGLGDDEMRELETAIMADPDGGVPIVGAGGLRKIRFSPATRAGGKSGASATPTSKSASTSP